MPPYTITGIPSASGTVIGPTGQDDAITCAGSTDPNSSLCRETYDGAQVMSLKAAMEPGWTLLGWKVNGTLVDQGLTLTSKANASQNGIIVVPRNTEVELVADQFRLEMVAGDQQTGVVYSRLSDALKVKIVDSSHQGVDGQTIQFEVIGVPQGSTGASLSPSIVVTDVNGEAASLLTLGDKAGTYTVTASTTDPTIQQGSPQTFTATATILKLEKVSGDQQFAPINSTLPLLLNVKIIDHNGNGVGGKTLQFALTVPPTTTGASLSHTTVVTDANGEAKTSLTLGDKAGIYTVTVTAIDPEVQEGSPQTFTTTGVKVEIIAADVAQDAIRLRLEPEGLTGTLSLELTSPATHQIRSEERTGSTAVFTETFDINNLVAGEYGKVKATWTVEGVAIDHEFDYHIRVLGMYNHTRYNTPTESYCSGSGESFSYLEGPGFDCMVVQCDEQYWHEGTALSGWLFEVEQNGSGYSSTLGYVTLEGFCPRPGAVHRFRRVPHPCPKCGGTLTVGMSVARNSRNTALPCGAEVYVHEVGVVTVQDTGGGLAMDQLDHYAGTSGCNSEGGTIGRKMTIRLF